MSDDGLSAKAKVDEVKRYLGVQDDYDDKDRWDDFLRYITEVYNEVNFDITRPWTSLDAEPKILARQMFQERWKKKDFGWDEDKVKHAVEWRLKLLHRRRREDKKPPH